MEKHLIHSNELHLIDAEKIHQGEKLIMYWESKKIDMN